MRLLTAVSLVRVQQGEPKKRIWKFNFPNPFLPTYGFKLQTKLRAFFCFDLVTLFPLHG